jgi:hypothetical protein
LIFGKTERFWSSVASFNICSIKLEGKTFFIILHDFLTATLDI